VIYFAYTVWIQPYFGTPKRKAGDRTKKPRKVEPADIGQADGADGPAVATGAQLSIFSALRLGESRAVRQGQRAEVLQPPRSQVFPGLALLTDVLAWARRTWKHGS
jgi:hypothetical protein